MDSQDAVAEFVPSVVEKVVADFIVDGGGQAVFAAVVGILFPVADSSVFAVGDEARQEAIGAEGEGFPYSIGIDSFGQAARCVIASLFDGGIVDLHCGELTVGVVLVGPEAVFYLP